MYDIIYSPWRSPYFAITDDECVFCNISEQIMIKNGSCKESIDNVVNQGLANPDYSLEQQVRNMGKEKELHVFYNDSLCYAVMNLYPYTPGHFMLIPHTHVDSPSLLSQETWLHLSKLSQKAIAMLEEYGADGINMGINIKQAAGAGIPKHLHVHFVPRFTGDTNFITAIGNTRVYGVEFARIFDRMVELAKKYLC